MQFPTRVRVLILVALACVWRTAADAQTPGRHPIPISAQTSVSSTLDDQVSALISKMTLEEKASQMQDQAPAIPRLGLPAYGWWNEGLHGVANSGYATNFPQAIGLASTWNTALIHDVAEVISIEARAKHAEAVRQGSRARFYGLSFWSPNINIFRDPRWGRGQETYGEDPFLTSRMGVSFVTGLQGDDPDHPRVIATPKHFAVHSGPESLRHKFDVAPSPQDLEDTYLPAFRAAFTEAHAESVMCAYNAVEGKPACASDLLLKTHLREAWKFDGYVVSDCGAIDDIFGGHQFAKDGPAAASLAIKSGTDLDCGHIYRQIPQAVKQNLLTEAEVDIALRRLLRAKARLGILQGTETGDFANIPFSEVNSEAHRRLALKTARESIVLLKNRDAILPLSRPGVKIALVGPATEYLASVQGNYSGTPLRPVLPIAGMQAVFGDSNVSYAQGSTFVEGTLLPISRTALRPIGSHGLHGLTAEYFNTLDFSGPPALVRVDPAPNFNFTEASPGAGVNARTFAVRWSAALAAPADGKYRLGLHLGECYACKDRVAFRMFLDGKALLDSDHLAAEIDKDNASVAVQLTGSTEHSLVVEYMHREAGGQVDIVWEAPAEVLLNEAAKVASESDAIVAFVGLSTNLEGEEMKVKLPGFAGGDRTSLDLPAPQQRLLERMAATGKPLVVVLLNGSALAVNWAQQHADAILEAWYPGEEGGTAIAETLAGKSNPAGRLPVTFYKSTDDLPPFEEYSMKERTYRYFTGTPLFPFGFGLSYTSFSYSTPKLSKTPLPAGDSLAVHVSVSNTGKMAGDEVVQLYLQPVAIESAPSKALRGFQRVHLAIGESRTLTFQLTDRDLSFVDAKGRRTVTRGKYRIFVGGGQPATDAAGKEVVLTITGKRDLPL